MVLGFGQVTWENGPNRRTLDLPITIDYQGEGSGFSGAVRNDTGETVHDANVIAVCFDSALPQAKVLDVDQSSPWQETKIAPGQESKFDVTMIAFGRPSRCKTVLYGATATP